MIASYPIFEPSFALFWKGEDSSRGLCCHPYDVCTELIAREAGVLITNHIGQPLKVSLDLESDVSWVGYANLNIRKLIEPLLCSALHNRGMMN